MRISNPNRNFTIVSNEIHKHGLSLRAVGLYGYICSKPDGWDFSIAGTASQVKEGKDAIRSAIKELEVAGFLQCQQMRNSDGSMGESIWQVYNSPSEKPETAEPSTGASRLSNTVLSKTRERGKNSLSLSFEKSIELADGFIKEQADKFGVKETAIRKSCDKYFMAKSDEGKRVSLPGLALWLTREKWDEDDFTTAKQNQMARDAIMNGEW